MNLFEQILRDVLLAGQVAGPIFIHSPHGVAILNGTQDGLAAILQAHQQAQGTQPASAPPANNSPQK
jgi:hypothetical protein